MEKGISVYLGLGAGLEEIREYLALAKKYGYSRLFTSLHIPEADHREILRDFRQMTKTAANLGFRITADISPRTFKVLEIAPEKPEAFLELGIHTLRLDFGFQLEETLLMAKSLACELELNASTVDKALLEQLFSAGISPERLRACHNFYPRPETGLSYEHFSAQSRLCKEAGIPVFAFISSNQNPRGPIFQGLPTLERHRYLSPAVAAKDLLAGELVSGLIFGDPFASPEELEAVAALTPGILTLSVDVLPSISEAERQILFSSHTNRMDPGEWVIRSQEARELCQKDIIPGEPRLRNRGAVTVDNQKYLRYMGELQVVRQDLPANERVNVVAQVVEEELFLLDILTPGGRFSFQDRIKGSTSVCATL